MRKTALSRPLCLKGPCVYYSIDLPHAAPPNPIRSIKVGGGAQSPVMWVINGMTTAHPHLPVLWEVLSEYHEHKYSFPVWSSCILQKEWSWETMERQWPDIHKGRIWPVAVQSCRGASALAVAGGLSQGQQPVSQTIGSTSKLAIFRCIWDGSWTP